MDEILKAELLPLLESLDVYLYFGGISRQGYRGLTSLISQKALKDSAVLVLTTSGGDPDAGYRIGRALGHYYPNGFKVMVADICKSAGTLVTLAAKELIIGDRGELGPLDIQLRKPDEIFENGSGLDIIQAISALKSSNFDAFHKYMLDIRIEAGLSTKLSADIATKLAAGLIAPMAAHVDPLRLGEHQRAMAIAYKYGERLAGKFGNLKNQALDRLVTNYPSHGFVIDRKEASELFCSVNHPTGPEIALCDWVCRLVDAGTANPYSEVIVFDLAKAINNNADSKTGELQNDVNNSVSSTESENSGIDGQAERNGDGGS